MVNWILHLPAWVWIAIVVHLTIMGAVAYFILLERKVASWAQDRVGPNRAGPGGLLQPIADGIKFVVKEDFRPAGIDKMLYTIAPAIMMIVMVVSIAVIPWGGWVKRSATVSAATQEQAVAMAVPSNGTLIAAAPAAGSAGQWTVDYKWPFQIANLNIGVLFIIAVLSLGVYGVVLGGWASNNKYSFLGGLRATAQMISYEIPLGLSLLAVVLMFGTLDLGEIVEKQAHYWAGVMPAWNVFTQPLAFVLFLICIHAEANRSPFDLAEAEQELVGGYHTEYSALSFGLFFLAEYAGMITTSAVCVALFFGGWHFPGLTGDNPADPTLTGSLAIAITRSVVFFAKILLIVFVFMWVRWSLPRFRFDQLMMVAWKAMIPLSLALVMFTGIVLYVMSDQPRAFMRIGGKLALALLGMNVVLLAGSMVLSRLLPAGPNINRRVRVLNSRFTAAPTEAAAS